MAKYKKKQKPQVRPKVTVSHRSKESDKNKEQQRAEHAWRKARLGVAQHGKDYINDAKGLPALIMNSGLMQTLAFLERKEDRHRLLSAHLREWLHESHGTSLKFEGFMEELFESNSGQFQSVNREAYAWLRWLRQLASALKED